MRKFFVGEPNMNSLRALALLGALAFYRNLLGHLSNSSEGNRGILFLGVPGAKLLASSFPHLREDCGGHPPRSLRFSNEGLPVTFRGALSCPYRVW
jgi:hypothetical protein